MAAELPDFDLERALRIGLVPMVVDGSAPESTLDAYASLYIDQEVRAEGLTRNVGAFARFLEAITFCHGGQLNISAVARECEVGRKAVRTRGGSEVDFVVYGRAGFHGLEVKNARRVHSTDLRALRTFRADYPEADAALLYRGRERLKINGIWCLPVDEFLKRIAPGRGLLDWV